MSIQIDIRFSSCRAGNTISETVTLHGSKDADTKLVTIRLVAKSKICITRQVGYVSQTYNGKAYLLNDMKELFAGPPKVHPGTSWPCTFTMHYSNVRTPFLNKGNSAFNSDPGQILPPSYLSGMGYSNHITLLCSGAKGTASLASLKPPRF